MPSGVLNMAATSSRNSSRKGVLSIDIASLKFDSGQQLLDMVADLKTELKEGEVRQ